MKNCKTGGWTTVKSGASRITPGIVTDRVVIGIGFKATVR